MSATDLLLKKEFDKFLKTATISEIVENLRWLLKTDIFEKALYLLSKSELTSLQKQKILKIVIPIQNHRKYKHVVYSYLFNQYPLFDISGLYKPRKYRGVNQFIEEWEIKSNNEDSLNKKETINSNKQIKRIKTEESRLKKGHSENTSDQLHYKKGEIERSLSENECETMKVDIGTKHEIQEIQVNKNLDDSLKDGNYLVKEDDERCKLNCIGNKGSVVRNNIRYGEYELEKVIEDIKNLDESLNYKNFAIKLNKSLYNAQSGKDFDKKVLYDCKKIIQRIPDLTERRLCGLYKKYKIELFYSRHFKMYLNFLICYYLHLDDKMCDFFRKEDEKWIYWRTHGYPKPIEVLDFEVENDYYTGEINTLDEKIALKSDRIYKSRKKIYE